ncbi:hypothetical protein EDC94DRAFT_614809 [Helicostylum pulchrum]|uniref:Beta-lactamase n=1 Tax=Helicostylum pulchrum TaxID=562976 RepID=A0ABP9Y235_9FUNG|nr:hypothetical protein EDC94DRAFT_614809 [Helicostylum pulchrum]
MNRLRKALSMDYDNANSKEVAKKRFSLFSNKSKSNLVVEIPTCVEEYASPSAPINIQQHSDMYNRPRSVNIDNSSSNVSFNSSITSNSTHNVKSIHSNDISSPIPTSRSIHKDQFDNESLLQLGMNYHEKGELEKATHYWRLSAETGSPLGLFFYGIALRHGWGCKKNSVKAVRYLQSAAESAVHELQTGIAQSVSVAKSELVLAIYELGVCFRHGWGVPKNLETAAYYFEVASNLGDPDAQNDLGFCYAHGLGVKKDLYCSAKYYRLAEKQGQGMIGNSWIWKDKYNQVEEPGWKGKLKK